MMKFTNYPLTIKVLFEREATDAPYVAYIPEFDLSSCGRTEMEAVENVKDALNLVIEEAEKDGTLDELLEGYGIYTNKKQEVIAAPKIIIEHFSLKN